MSTVLKDALLLSVEDRLQLIEEIWDSLAVTPEAIPVTEAQRRELARRRRAPAAIPQWRSPGRKYGPSSNAEGKASSSHPGTGRSAALSDMGYTTAFPRPQSRDKDSFRRALEQYFAGTGGSGD